MDRKREGYRYLKVTVPQKDPRPLERFLRAVDQPQSKLGGYDGDMRRIQWSGRPAERIASLLEPFLTEPKREQLAAAREEVDAAKSRSRPLVS